MVQQRVEHDRDGLHTVRGMELGRIVESARAFLFDFDGPVCSVFAGRPSPPIAASLIQMLRTHCADLELDALDTSDPLDVLRYSEKFGPAAVAQIENALVDAELQAVRSAAPTPGGARSIRSCVASGRLAAIITNNSERAVEDYLARHHLSELVQVVVGRPYAEPHRMKPSGEPVQRALDALSVEAAGAVLVGDSLSDIEAARAAGTACIGFANKAPKLRRLAAADSVIDDMALLASAIRAAPVDSTVRRA